MSKKVEWKRWSIGNVITILLVLGATGAALVRAEGRIDANAHHLETHSQAIDSVAEAIKEVAKTTSAATEKVAEAVHQSEKNTAVLMQWQREQDRRLNRLEDSGLE